jgi:hypothetical protein
VDEELEKNVFDELGLIIPELEELEDDENEDDIPVGKFVKEVKIFGDLEVNIDELNPPVDKPPKFPIPPKLFNPKRPPEELPKLLVPQFEQAKIIPGKYRIKIKLVKMICF